MKPIFTFALFFLGICCSCFGFQHTVDLKVEKVVDAVDTGPTSKGRTEFVAIYPYEMKRHNISGTVSARLTVDEDGKISDVSIGKATREEFEKAVKESVGKSAFYPARIGKKSVRCQIECTFVFIVIDD